MAVKPVAEIPIEHDLVRALLESCHEVVGEASALPLTKAAEGWDCEMWRLGDELAVRLPRRRIAARLIDHEHIALPIIAPLLRSAGVDAPVPIIAAAPSTPFPWPWSVVPWFPGTPGLAVPRAQRSGWAEPLACALVRLHSVPPVSYPTNPVRGVPLATRAADFDQRMRALRRSGAIDVELLRSVAGAWDAALAARPWARQPVWIHGDLHPANIVADGGRLVAMVDFGDVTAGDPAYDLAVAWLSFEHAGRAQFIASTGGAYDEGTWRRARGWAAAVATMLLSHSDDVPEYNALGRSTILELAGDPVGMA